MATTHHLAAGKLPAARRVATAATGESVGRALDS